MPGQQLSEPQLDTILTRLKDEDIFVFLETTRVTAEEHLSLLFLHPQERLICRKDDDPSRFFSLLEEKLSSGLHLAGWMAFEFGYLLEPILAQQFKATSTNDILADFFVFSQPYVFNHKKNSFERNAPWPDIPDTASQQFLPGNADYTLSGLKLNQNRAEYLNAIHRIKEYIAAGDTYQVNHTLKFKFNFSGSLAGFYKTLRRNQSVSYGAFIKTPDHHIMSFSPELFFRKKGLRCQVRPMKGTIRRGPTVVQDKALADLLKCDLKNRSENVMIVDLLRNDLGRLCRTGSVTVSSLFDVETYETLHQMTSTILGELLPDINYAEIFKALFPNGSVTGAPKIRTMQIIRELELESRGIYTGAIGYISPDGNAQFNVPIRTIILDEKHCEMGVGSGIVFDSDPQNEWEECQLKGQFLTNPTPIFALIETLLWVPGQGYWLLDLHMERLLESAQYFGFIADRDTVINALNTFSNQLSNSPKRLRLTLHRDGATSWAATDCSLPKITELVEEEPSEYLDLPQIVISDVITDSSSTFLYHKTTQRHLYDQERERIQAAGHYEIIFQNQLGEITEGSVTNLFIKKNKKLLTPPVACGLLPGVFRKYLLKKYPGQLEEKVLTRNDLTQADAIYVGNSVRGLVQVRLAECAVAGTLPTPAD